MDKITHQVRAEHWVKIMNECINSGMFKTAWCRANGIAEKQFFYWQRIFCSEALENFQNSSLPATVGPQRELAPAVQRAVSFAEIKILASSQSTALVFHLDFVIRKGSLILEISNSASDELLCRIYTDLRYGIDGLVSIVKLNFQLDSYEKDILFLFGRRRSDRIKGLICKEDGFLLLYKRLELGINLWFKIELS